MNADDIAYGAELARNGKYAPKSDRFGVPGAEYTGIDDPTPPSDYDDPYADVPPPDDDESPGDETVKTVPWPTLSDAALQGPAGKIVNLVAPHTEADPAAILVQLLAVFGATLGPSPHIMVANEKHRAVINPLIIGRTSNGAKGTSLGVVEVVRKHALPWFDEFTTSGLSTAEGLIELVRDPSGDESDKDYDPGVADKRLLVKETEYKSVLARGRRDGNTLTTTLRQAFDGGTLRTLTRKRNKLTATDAHIVVIGHITPREFRSALDDSDLAGGSINRLMPVLSRRSRLNVRFGNIPEPILAQAGELFGNAQKTAQHREAVSFTDDFWSSWEPVYTELNRDRPDSWVADATARAVTQVLRLSLIYTLFDSAPHIDSVHLDAALALWAYAEHSAKWLFSTHEQELERDAAGGLAKFILAGGPAGRTRTEIYRSHFKSNAKAAEITAQLTPLVHDGIVSEVREETGARPITRYVHRTQRINAFTDFAGQDDESDTYATHLRTDAPTGPEANAYKYVPSTYPEIPSELGDASNTLIRNPDAETGSPGVDRAVAIAARLNAEQAVADSSSNVAYINGLCRDCGDRPHSAGRPRCDECHHIHVQGTQSTFPATFATFATFATEEDNP